MIQATDALVLIHGFGVDARHFSSWLPTLQSQFSVTTIDLPGFGSRAGDPWPASQDQLVDDLLPRLPERAIYCGWSAGGIVAALLARRYPARVAGILLLASNPVYVARDSDNDRWPGMEPAVFNDFQQAFIADPDAIWPRFDYLLAQGGVGARHAVRELNRLRIDGATQSSAARKFLHSLDESDGREVLRALRQPITCVYAANDVLVPVACADAMRKLLPAARVLVIENAGHWLWRDASAACTEALLDLRGQVAAHESAYRRDKRALAQSFGRAAGRYDAVAQIQATVRDVLLARCDAGVVDCILDLGCGTGLALDQLRRHYRGASLLAADLAEGMLQVARARQGDALWLAADAEKLPLADASVDRVVSSLALQWCESPAAWLQEIWRVLKPGGRAFVATLGTDTLNELYRAWCVADPAHVHVNAFVSLQELRLAAAALPWSQAQIDEQLHCDRHASLRDVLRSIKDIGAHNINAGRARGLTGRRQLLALQQAYESFRVDGYLPASYHVIFCELHKP
jgi:malonyl-CoA O-methyltransferase